MNKNIEFAIERLKLEGKKHHQMHQHHGRPGDLALYKACCAAITTLYAVGDTEILEAIDRLVTYSWGDEERDFKEQLVAGENTDRHIFRDLLKINEYLRRAR